MKQKWAALLGALWGSIAVAFGELLRRIFQGTENKQDQMIDQEPNNELDERCYHTTHRMSGSERHFPQPWVRGLRVRMGSRVHFSLLPECPSPPTTRTVWTLWSLPTGIPRPDHRHGRTKKPGSCRWSQTFPRYNSPTKRCTVLTRIPMCM
ncbi:uncharacterized protein BDZ83DRAFT_31575 [Colletotrichum acutatum]|uniref:Uncharacterized protein n=1 Tax=Glomerella acutata TaxID=27357 RepID=A0AAD8XLA3_GLOAC|nr:uncharacterized protein BDZ83DRAFT_31575 [Colletotrichum acutatum]KAK1729409.1 hypothetical protein BDZ83DRAFT_31575 [Colletotrichum acutatum]